MSEFGRLIEQEIPRLRRYARALTRDIEQADDLVQNCLVRALAKERLWQFGTNLRAWLFTVLHNGHINSVRRSIREQTDAVAEARERVLKDMLDVVDNLERAVGMQAAGNGKTDGAAVLKGVDLVLRLLKQKLERYEVRPFDAAGQPFDPRLHEAISRVEHAEIPAGSVAAELQKGYRVGERLLRPACHYFSPDAAA